MYLCNYTFVFLYQPVDELSEGLVWASKEGCLEDVVFLLSTEVEVNSRGQVRERVTLLGQCTYYTTALTHSPVHVHISEQLPQICYLT